MESSAPTEPAEPIDAAEIAAQAEFVAQVAAQGRSHRTACGAGTMAWRDWGAGKAVVLLHGGHGAWSHWIRNIPILAAAGYRVLAPDMPGFGESDMAPEPYSAESIAEIVLAGITELLGPQEPFTVAGFSFGGSVASNVARLAGPRAERLVLVCSGGMDLPRPPRPRAAFWRNMTSEAERLAAHRGNLRALMIHDPAKVDALAIYLQNRNTVRTRVRSRPISATDTVRRCLPQIAGKVCGIWGEKCASSYPYVDQRRQLLQEIRPGAPFILIPGGGHWVQYEASDAFNAALLSLLAA